MERQVVGNNALGRGSIRPLDIRPLRVNPSDMSTIRFRPPVSPPSAEQVRDEVRRHYATAANPEACCENEGKGGCGDRNSATDATSLGYTEEEISALPEGADLGLGCGNPQAIAALKPGETVLDLGSGAGFDCFLAARAVGPTGRSLGVDMTHEMLAKARATALRAGFANTEFRLGEIEALPVADASVDVIISNCVVNLSPDKPRVLREAFRVLKPGGSQAWDRRASSWRRRNSVPMIGSRWNANTARELWRLPKSGDSGLHTCGVFLRSIAERAADGTWGWQPFEARVPMAPWTKGGPPVQPHGHRPHAHHEVNPVPHWFATAPF